MSRERREQYKQQLVNLYVKFVELYKKDPTKAEFTDFVHLVDNEGNEIPWTNFYRKLSDLRADVLVDFSDVLEDNTFNEEDFATADYYERAMNAISKHNRFVIATAVNNKPVDIEFLNALVSYADKNNACLLWLASHDVRSAKRTYEWNFDPALKCGYIVTKDMLLNSNLMISAITVSAKQINPLTGVDRFAGKYDRSIIFPGCKQQWQYVATRKGKEPHLIACTGAITVPDYSNDLIMSGRTSYIAERDHLLGATIVEIENDNIFHVRVIQSTEDGSFTDLGVKYYPDGTTAKSKNAVLVQGDSHVGSHDRELFSEILSLMKDSDFITTTVLHDICNSSSVSHHEANDFIKKVTRALEGSDDMVGEATEVVDYLNQLTSLSNLQVVVVNSNHDRHIERYIKEARAFKDRDFKNTRTACALFLELTKEDGALKNPVKFLVENISSHPLNNPDRITWLGLDESYVKYGVELGMHGDLGANGGRGSLQTYEKSVYNAVVAHAHSAAIKQKVFRVGTTSEMDMGYNHGLSSWTRTCCLVYEDGTKQLINFIPNGKGGYSYHV